MIDINQISMLDLLPPNLRGDPAFAAAAKALDSELQAINAEVRKLSIYDRYDEWTEEETDELAWQFHVDFYDPSLPLAQRRELVKNSIGWHRRKGTPSAVEELVATLFGEGKVEEWFEYGGDPFYFRVVTNNPEVTTARAQEFSRAVNSVKRLTARLERIVLGISEEVPLYYAGVLHMSEKMTVRMV